MIHHPGEGVPHPNYALLEDMETTIQQQITTPQEKQTTEVQFVRETQIEDFCGEGDHVQQK